MEYFLVSITPSQLVDWRASWIDQYTMADRLTRYPVDMQLEISSHVRLRSSDSRGMRMLGALSKHILIGLRIAATLALLHCVSAFMRAEQLPIRTYSTADGLGSTFIIRIVRDTKGFLWFCTRDGLSRLDR